MDKIDIDLDFIEKALDFANMYIWVLDVEETREGRRFLYKYVSKGIEKFIDVKRDRLIGTPSFWIDYVYPDDRHTLEETQKILSIKREIRERYRIIDKNGKIRWLESYIYPELSDNGELKAIRGYTIDITERVKLQNKIQRSHIYLYILHKIGLLLLLKDEPEVVINYILKFLGSALNADRTYWFAVYYKDGRSYITQRAEWVRDGVTPQLDNPNTKDQPHGDKDSLIYKKLSRGKIFHERVKEISYIPTKELLETQDIKVILIVPIYIKGKYLGFLGADNTHNEELWDEESVSLFRTAAEMFGSLLLREKKQKELVEVSTRFRTLMESMPLLIAFRDKERRWIYANSATEEYLGLKGIDYIGKTTFEISNLLKDEELKEVFRRGVTFDGEVFMSGKIVEYPLFYRKDGRDIYLFIKKIPILDEDENITGVLAIGIDVTKERIKEKEREDMQKRLMYKQKLESMGLMASGISHDFNNILTVISGNISMLKELNKDKLSRRYFDNIENAIDRAKSLISSILAYTGKRVSSEENVELNSEVDKIYNLLMVSIPKNIEIVIYHSQKPIYVNFSPSQFQQVIMNLIINARDAIGKAKGLISILINKRFLTEKDITELTQPMELKEGEYALIEVKDNGPGIPSEVLDNIFDPFFSTKSSGRGLGLSVLFGLVKGHGGGINILTERNKGTTFQIFVPISKTEKSETLNEQKDSLVTRHRKRLNILVIDDEPWIREILVEILSVRGYRVEAVEDGYKALEIIEEKPDYFDLTIIDYNMPGINGLETCKRIKEIAPNISIILSSGFAFDTFAKEIEAEGLRFIPKPYKIDELERIINEVIKDNSFSN